MFAHDFYVPGKLYFDILYIYTMAGKNGSIPQTSFQSIANCMYDERTMKTTKYEKKKEKTNQGIHTHTHSENTATLT